MPLTIDEINDLFTEAKYMQLNFDAMTVQPSTGGSTFFPLGDYPFQVTKVEAKKVKDKQNEGFLEVTLSIQAGPLKGSEHLDRFNLWNSSQKAVDIAYSQLSSLCRVIGRPKIVNDTDLVGGYGIATIGPQIANGILSDKYSEVKVYKDVQGRVNGIGEPVSAPQPVAAAATPAQGTAPWNAGQAMPTQEAAPATAPPATGWQTGAPAAATVPAAQAQQPANPFASAPAQTAGNPFSATPAAGAAAAPPWATPQQ